jgi:hypothetical protein
VDIFPAQSGKLPVDGVCRFVFQEIEVRMHNILMSGAVFIAGAACVGVLKEAGMGV